MKKTTFYPNIWQVIPYSFNMNDWDSEGRLIKDVVVTNWYATHNEVAEMHLNIIKFAALDSEGVEHFITDFKGNGAVPIRGMHKGEFLRSKSILLLEPGTYSTFRFYLGKTGSSFVHRDGREENIQDLQYLDFEIEGGLSIQGNEAPEVILRFDFVPFATARYFQNLGAWFKRPRGFGGRLANSLGA